MSPSEDAIVGLSLSDTLPAQRGIVIPRALLIALLVLLPLLLTLLLHLTTQGRSHPVDSQLIRLVQGSRITGGGLTPPSDRGERVILPLQIRHGDPGDIEGATWVRVKLPQVEVQGVVWTLEVRYRPSVLVLFDGHLLAHSTSPRDGDLPSVGYVHGVRELHVDLPPDMLRGANHEVALRLGAPEETGSLLEPLWLGPQESMLQRDHDRHLVDAPRTMTTVAAAVVGVFLVLLWLLARNEWLYGLAGLHLLLLALLLSAQLSELTPMPDQWWRLAVDAADVGAKALLLVIVARLALDRPSTIITIAVSYSIIGLALDGWAAWNGLSWGDFREVWPWWALGSRALVFTLAWALSLVAVWRRASIDTIGMALVVGMTVMVWGYLNWFSLVQPAALPVYDFSYVAYAGWVMLLGVLLLGRFAHTLRREARLRTVLESRLAQRTRELATSFEALRSSERARAVAERARAVADERERLMQEMHDGIGAQLIAARLQVAAGGLNSAQSAALIDDCLLELRLTVDALSLDDGNLGALLAALRPRLAPGLQAAGMTLDWEVQATPDLPVLNGPGARELLRLVQEAVSNVLHHSGATRLVVATTVAHGAVQLSVRDDGVGRRADAHSGRGTQSMRRRAERLGAHLVWISPVADGRGTEVRLRLALPMAVGAPAAARPASSDADADGTRVRH